LEPTPSQRQRSRAANREIGCHVPATARRQWWGVAVAEACRQRTGSQPFAFVDVENGSLTKFTVETGGRWPLRSFNDTAHLTGVPSPLDR